MVASIFSVTGQLNRRRYLMQLLVSVSVSLFCLGLISAMLGKGFVLFLQQNSAQETLAASAAFYLFYIGFAAVLILELLFLIHISIRRLHATQHSAWWLIIIFIPIINLLLLVWLFLMPSTSQIK